MIKLILKILKTPKNAITVDSAEIEKIKIDEIGKKLETKIAKLFRGSLAIRQVDAGSDNACEQELAALSNSFYDVERFGIHFVASPRHADVLLVTGPVTRNMAEAVRRAYDAMPDPKIVIAIGDDAIDGGIFKGSYAVAGAVSDVIPVDFIIPGDPPTPALILAHLLKILESIDSK